MNNYSWEKVGERKYKLIMDIDMFSHHRISKTGDKINWFDPGGGPAICLGRVIENGKYITKIEIIDNEVIVEVNK